MQLERIAFIRIHAIRSSPMFSHVEKLGTGKHFRATCSLEDEDMTSRSGLATDLRLTCKAETWAIRDALGAVESFLTAHDVRKDDIDDIQLVLAEAMTNIVRHAYPVNLDQIWLRVRLRGDRLECDLQDRGVAFDPGQLGKSLPEPATCREGGYGWFIIRSLSEGLCYSRKNGRNTLTFSVPLIAMT